MLKKIALMAGVAMALTAPGLAQERPYPEGQRPGLSNERAFPNLTLIYRFTGLHDSGGAHTTGTASTLICTNWGPPATIRTVLRAWDPQIIGAATQAIATGQTVTGSTKITFHYTDDFLLIGSPAMISQGSLLVYSTSPQVQCTAVGLDAANGPPTFTTTLPAQRLNPAPGVTE